MVAKKTGTGKAAEKRTSRKTTAKPIAKTVDNGTATNGKTATRTARRNLSSPDQFFSAATKRRDVDAIMRKLANL